LDNTGVVIFDLQPRNHTSKRLFINENAQWCKIRTIVFGWTQTRFLLHIRLTRELTINETPIISVIGKAVWDIGPAPKDGQWVSLKSKVCNPREHQADQTYDKYDAA
jgi:hypothetical protein